MKNFRRAVPVKILSALIFAAAITVAVPMNIPAASADASLSESEGAQMLGWAVLEGSSLRLSLEGWSDAAGWTLVWDSPADYRLGASAAFSGSFENAVSNLLNAIYPTAPEIVATLYRGNYVLHIASSFSASTR
ncbi:MAG: toxin co-regulated pilus biosynthesis Q family protein [Albidovulum sp.]|nr:toxin co-regulated pilus biosynthesis Q family protein [Albidovulum sp.]MDE0534195.1 toxin co-regulated pilus biosynthesis Q family protein [Albidovulum sp.]